MSNLTVVSPAPSRLLTSATLLEQSRPEGADQDQLLAFAQFQSALFERIAGRVLAREGVIEQWHPARFPRLLFLSRAPLIELHQLAINGVDLVEGQDFAITDGANSVIRLTCPGATSPGVEIKADYTAGYILPDWENPPDGPHLPFEVQGAVAAAAKEALEHGATGAKVSERIGDYAVTYANTAAQSAGNGGRALPEAALLTQIAATYRLVRHP